jgi:succinyl-CoA synthetase beta subunit
MNIHEYQAKEILRKYGIPTSHGVVALRKKEIDDLINNLEAKIYVVKAQIHAGGRGKVGGVKVVRSKEDAKRIAHEMYDTTLVTHQTGPAGQKVRRIYIESGCDILKEYYFSAVLDSTSGRVTFMASTEGGIDIEEVAEHSPEKIIRVSVDPATGVQPFHCRQIAFGLELKGIQAKQMMGIVEAINFDDNGLFRHPDIQVMRDEDEEDPLETRASNAGLSYVKMEGNIGCMVNGAGLAMATMDIIKLYGAQPANFLDVGGGADHERVTEAFRIILSDPAVKGILVNIFGGIMRCDIIAGGIIEAAKDVHLAVPLVVRLAGTNVELGKQILANSGLKIIPADDLADAAQKIVAAIK